MSEEKFKKLTIVTHVDHIRNKDGSLIAYAPYVREIDLWCELFEEVHIYAPGFRLSKNTSLAKFKYKNIKHHFLLYNNSSNLSGVKNITLINKILIFIRILEMPMVFFQLLMGILKSDILLIRSPGHTALTANLILRFIKKTTIVKWAGGFHNYPNERTLSKLERKLLLKCNDKTRVLVYDKIEHPHFVRFIPALMSEEEIEKGIKISEGKTWGRTTSVLCVGRLSRDKGFELVLDALDIINKRKPGYEWELTIVGDGGLKSWLTSRVEELKLNEKVTFTGALSFHDTQNYYAKANIVIMPGIKEGWPKVIAEAWAHKALVFAANRGNVPDILSSGAGVLFEPDPEDLANRLIEYFHGDIPYLEKTELGAETVKDYSLETFKARIKNLILELKSD